MIASLKGQLLAESRSSYRTVSFGVAREIIGQQKSVRKELVLSLIGRIGEGV